MEASQHLMANGFYVPPIVQMGVPKDQPRLRFFLSATHTPADIRNVLELVAARRDERVVEAHQLSPVPGQ